MGRAVIALACSSLLTASSSTLWAQAPLFTDVTAETGLDFRHFTGASGAYYFPEIAGAGGALFDYDGDGDLDLYLVQGAMLGPGRTYEHALFEVPAPLPLSDRLFRNDLSYGPGGDRRMRFVDVTDEAGIAACGYGMGVAIGDYDGDGHRDLYVTNFGSNQMWRNRGDGTFDDVTAETGTNDLRWTIPAAFLDFDRDGRLDLFLANYVDFNFDKQVSCLGPSGARDYCGPRSYAPVTDRLFRNLGRGADGRVTFGDVTGPAGVGGVAGPALGVAAADFDGDGWTDLYVANDGAANFLWINRGDGRFTDEALFRGCAVDAEGRSRASMGVDFADFDGDGDEDLFMTHLVGETNTLYVNDGGGFFRDASSVSGLGTPSWHATAFGTAWFDYDNDGWLDVVTVNGAVASVRALRQAQDPYPYHQPDQLFRNLGPAPDGGGQVRFEEVTVRAGPAFARSETGRGAIFGDVDNDTDLVISNNNGPARLLLNEAADGKGWLGLRLLAGKTRTEMPGTRVSVLVPGRPPIWRRVRLAASYGSSIDPRTQLVFRFGETMRAITSISLVLLFLVTVHTSGKPLRSQEVADALDESPPTTATRASAQPRTRTVILEIEIHGESAEPVPATVQATPVTLDTDEEEQDEHLEVPVEIPGTSSLNFPTDGMWRVSLQADGFWSQELIVGPHPKGQIDMTVYPLVAVSGRVVVEEGATLPDQLMLRFQAVASSPGSLREIEGTDQCPVDDEGWWKCQAPGGNFDLRLGADGFVSHFFWERNLAEEKARAFGALSLQTGASIVATIQTEDHSPITGDCTAALIPQMMPAHDPVAESRTRNLRNSILVGERGFVHFTGLTPGSYRMTVEQEGFATLTFEPILVRERQETELQQPLVLKRPLTLRATLLPEVDLYARPWLVDLRSTGFFPKRVASGLADLQGLWQAADLEPGPYSLTVSDSRGSRMAYQEFFLEAGRTELEIELLTVQVKGSVSLGNEPLFCQLSFGGRGPVAIRVETNLKGEYEAWLPNTGDWNIDVHAREPRVFRRLRNVPVEIDHTSRIARVDIELPETLIEGHVYEENGAPVGAAVLITRVPANERPSYGKTDEEGAFSIGGYPEGDYRLQASIKGEAGLRSSDTVQIEISKSQPTATARLVIKDLVSLRGKVVSASGGVPGVTVKARPLAAGSELPGLLFPGIVTDATGAFTVNVPRTATEIDITAFPPGFLLARLRLPVDPSRELLVPVRQQSGGTLVLQLEPSASSPWPETSLPFVIYDALLDLDFATLRAWALMNNATPHESGLTVPMLPPGNYSYCRRHRPARDGSAAGPRKPIQLCESGFLSPLGELRLDSPIGNDEDTLPRDERNQPAAN